MRARIAVSAVAFEGSAVVSLGQVELALLKINIAQRKMMMRFVEMVNLRLEFLNAPPGMGTGQFEATSGRITATINVEEIPERSEAGKREDENQPQPFASANRVHDHP